MTTIYFAGGEDIDFTLAGNAAGATGGAYDPVWSRSAVGASQGDAVWPIVNALSNPTSFGNLTNFWVHASASTSTTFVANNIFLALADSGGVGRILIRVAATTGTIKISSRNAAGTITDFTGATSTAVIPLSALGKFDVFVNYSSSGRIQVYYNGTLIADTGAGVNVTTDSATSLSFLYLSCFTTSASTSWWSQVIVADSDTRSMGLWTMNSSTSGTATQWTGTASNVNKGVINDTTFITSPTAAQINDYKPSTIALPAGVYTVPAVVQSMRALVGASGPQHVDMGFNFNGSRFWSSNYAPGVGFGNFADLVWATNPNTSAAWTTSDLTAATFNYSLQSVT
jgi:hypothetical protein